MRRTQIRSGQVYACERPCRDGVVPAMVLDAKRLWSVRPSLRFGRLGTLDFIPASPHAQISDLESFTTLTVANGAVTGILAVKAAPRAVLLRGGRRADLADAFAAMRHIHIPDGLDLESLHALCTSLPPYLTTTVVCPTYLLGAWDTSLHRMRRERTERAPVGLPAWTGSASTL